VSTKLTVGLVVLLAVSGSAGGAAAAARAGKRFVGSGTEHVNNGPKWERAAPRLRISFSVAPDGKRLVGFRGTYFYYCGAGSGTITDGSIAIGRNGHFRARGSFADKTSSGQVTARSYVSIWGRMVDHGDAAVVSFLVNAVWTGRHLANPYSTKLQPAGLACQTWVKGGAHA